MDGLDHRDVVGDALLGGSKGEEVLQMLVLEVGPVEDPEWRVNIEVTIKGNGEAGVMEVSDHITKLLRGGRVYAEIVCISGDIHWHDGVSGSRIRENKGGKRNSIG